MGVRDKIPNMAILILLIVSTIAYALQAISAYAVVIALPLAETIIAISIGAIFGAILQSRYYHAPFNGEPAKDEWISIAGALLVGVSVVIILIAYKSLPLTSVYPLIATSVIVFLAIDMLRYGKKLSFSEGALLSLGVILVAIGVFLAESKGYIFNVSTLPIILGIAVTSGLGFYGMLYDLKKHKEGTKLITFSLVLFLIGAVMLAMQYQFTVSIYLLYGIASGFILSFAIGTELHAMRLEHSGTRKRDVLQRNFINNFTYLDIVLVLIAGVAINSYTVEGIFGGIAITAGVLVIGAAD